MVEGLRKPLHRLERGKRPILVVDGDVNSGFYTTTLLKRFDYDTSMVRTVEEALSTAADTKPSLIIISLQLNDREGPELLRQFKKNPCTDTVPVIAVQKKNDANIAQRCLECGAMECLVQPVPAEQLFRIVQKATEMRPRKDIRVRTLHPVKINKTLPESFETACALDLSERGAFLHAEKSAPIDTALSLQIDLNRIIIPVEAVVVYSHKTPLGPYLQAGMGIEFAQITADDQAYIRQFVRQEITRGVVSGHA